MKIVLKDLEGAVVHQCHLIDVAGFISFCSKVPNVSNFSILCALKSVVESGEIISFLVTSKEKSSLEERVASITDVIAEVISVTNVVEESLLSKDQEYFMYTLSRFLILATKIKGTILFSSSYEIQ